MKWQICSAGSEADVEGVVHEEAKGASLRPSF